MIRVRRSEERGHFDFGWLDTHHTFSFGEYHDPAHMGFRHLRVINEDRVQPGAGFPTHGHRDMEILTWILAGALEHRDSLGNGSVIRPGDMQRMSAGRGVTHSEFNPSTSEPVHLLQIWILPERTGLEPSYEERTFAEGELAGRLRLLASRDAREGSVRIQQDAELLAGRFAPGQRIVHELAPGRHAWLQIARGGLRLAGEPLAAGDGAALSGEAAVEAEATEDCEVLVFDLS
ncbi:MAG TPA: pirin family protein [Planctomycetota bacterium]|nr:pirin family protein [Planctomycetota bacterium]